MASKLNPPSTIVTRRKKRDLEATMKSLKKLLEPSSRSRKNNIPRSIPKKVSPKKTRSINRFENYENSSEDGEYYPNKLKRKDNTKKIMLKPKHELKVVIATNKRKRGTPQKGLKSLEERLTVLTSTKTSNQHESNTLTKSTTESQDTELPTQSILKPQVSVPFGDLSKSKLSVQACTNIRKYELVSPPHRSLTELTVDDLMRMDEDSLSEDDLMEVLTCPSPVWWEDPPDYFNEGVLYNTKTGDLDVRNEVIEETADNTSIINSTSSSTESKRTSECETKKSKKMAKLENILGNIKNKVQNKPENNENFTDKNIANDKSKDETVANNKGNVAHRTNDNDETDHNLKKAGEGNGLENNENDVSKNRHSPNGVHDTKRRKISSSGSDVSINDEDLLRNLENIDIPIHNADANCTKDINDSKNSKDIDGKPNPVTNVKHLEIQTANKSAGQEVANPSTAVIDSNKGILKTEKRKYVRKRPNKPTDDILDVRLIKMPTNATNEVRVWSKVENFQRHNLKPEEFDKVIDIENELVFSMIKCNNKTDPETICIDDDDDEQIKEVIDLDLDAIGKANNKIDSNFTDMAEIIHMNADKDIIKEDTIKISKDLDVRLIEASVSVDEISKPEQLNQAALKEKAIESPKPHKDELNKKEIRGIRILPINMVSKIPNSGDIKNTPKKLKKRTKKLIQQYAKDKTNRKIKGVKIINAKNDNVIRINDLDISIIKVNDHNIGRNKTPEVKNDLCITLVRSDNKSDEINKRIEVPSKTPVILPPLTKIVTKGKRTDKGKEAFKKSVMTTVVPSLTKNPNVNFESPKSINSISSETTDADGTISDTNIQFLDEYDDEKRSVDIVFESETIDIENKDAGNNSKESITPAEICIEKQVTENNAEKINVSN